MRAMYVKIYWKIDVFPLEVYSALMVWFFYNAAWQYATLLF